MVGRGNAKKSVKSGEKFSNVHDLDLFADIPVNLSHESSKFVQVPTITNLQNNELSSFEFVIAPTGNYIDLKKCQLELSFKILKETAGVRSAVDLSTDGNVALCNLGLHTLIERVEIFLGNSLEIVSSVDNSYGLRTYLEHILHYGTDAINSHLSLSGFYADEENKFNSFDANLGHKTRRMLFSSGRENTLLGYLNCSLFRQNKLLLNNCPLRIKIHLKPADYVLLGNKVENTTHSYVYEITKTAFHVCHVRVNEGICAAHESTLSKGYNANYNLLHSMTSHHTILKSQSLYHYENLFSGQIPSLVYIVFQESDAFNGSISKNCLELKHFNLERASVLLDGQSYPGSSLEFNFSSNNYLDGLNSIFTANGFFNKDLGLHCINRRSYPSGYTILCFDLSQNGYGSKTNVRDPTQIGNCAIDITFREPLVNSIVMSVFGYFKTSLQITASRDVLKFYR